jgi:hypothetical protein
LDLIDTSPEADAVKLVSRPLGLLFTLLAVSVALAAPVRADDEAGFKPLFNGKDLTGWRFGKESLDGRTATNDGRFKVEKGEIVINGPAKPGDPKMEEIDTAAEIGGGFVLRLEFKASRDANSGLHLRDHVFAHQLQIRDYPRVGPYKSLKNYQDGDWNAIEVVVTPKGDGTGGVARCTCNGEVLEAALPIPAKGPIGLQSETNEIRYRNVRLKPMP